MRKTPNNAPYKSLGDKLKKVRQRLQESQAEVSGAIEVDIEVLDEFEKGTQRPSEELLLLLISHFALKEDEADLLWQVAGYQEQSSETDDGTQQPGVMVMPLDVRIVYADMVHVMANNFGVVMNFMQTAGPNNQPLAVSRVGMSKEHARSVLEILQKTLEQADKNDQPKQVGSGDTTTDTPQ